MVIDLLEPHLPFEFIPAASTTSPTATFPNGVPNPLLPDNRQVTADTRDRLKHGADLGLAWDGDFDRCFLFDEKGTFIEGYYIVGLLAESILAGRIPGGQGRTRPAADLEHDRDGGKGGRAASRCSEQERAMPS